MSSLTFFVVFARVACSILISCLLLSPFLSSHSRSSFHIFCLPHALSCLLPGTCAPPPVYCGPLCSLFLFPPSCVLPSLTVYLSFTCLWPCASTSPAFGLVPPLHLWYTLAPSFPSLVFAPSRYPVLLTYSLADMLQAGWRLCPD